MMRVFFFVERSIVKFGKQIGRGGQGTVYEASVSWPYMDKATKMAVKKFNSKLGISQGQYPLELWTMDRFHVMRPRAFFFDDDASLCMLMPLFSCDLRSAIDTEMTKKSGPPFKEVISLSIIMQLAMGMQGLHSNGVCHRDLKAANILVTSIPMLEELEAEAGFKFMHMCSIADFENSEYVKGTAFWRAPEVLMSLRTEIPLTDLQWQAADVYSFGMMCYEIITGEIPFHDKLFSDYDLVINGGRPELPDYIPELLRNIIESCWHPNPECRPDFGEILGALKLKAQDEEETVSRCISLVWDLARRIQKSKSENLNEEVMQLKEILWRQYRVNDDAIVGHENYTSWGPKYVHYVEEFIQEFGPHSRHIHPLLPFVDYIKSQKLKVLMHHSLLAFMTTLDIAHDTQQHLKDVKEHGILFIEEKSTMVYMARNIYEETCKGIEEIGLKNDDNALTLKEKLKIVDDLVVDVKDVLDENAALGLIDNILVKMDPDRINDEIAIFQMHMTYIVRRTTFQKKYNTLLNMILGSIILYLIYTSPYCNYVLFRIFGVTLLDSYDIFLGFLCPLLEVLLFNRLVFRFPKYRWYLYLLRGIFSTSVLFKQLKSYGFRRCFGWIGIWYCFKYVILFFHVLIYGLHEYSYVKFIRLVAAIFTRKVKTKEE